MDKSQTDSNEIGSTPLTKKPKPSADGPGGTLVNKRGIGLMMIYLILLFIFSVYVLVKIWPRPTSGPEIPATGQAAPNSQSGGQSQAAGITTLPATNRPKGPSQVDFFWGVTWLWDEIRLLLIVIFAGSLGSLVHSIRSLYWYVGNRELVWSWMVMYLLLPFSGASIALVFYFVIRGGFFSPQAASPQNTLESVNPFGFAAISAVIGMFSQQAVLKLKEVAETLLKKPEPGADALPQEPLTVTGVIEKSGNTDGGEQVTIEGTGFIPGDQVSFGGVPATNVKVVESTRITAITPKHEAGTVNVVITRKGGKSVTLKDGYTYKPTD
jgi:hypothetical protein